jgi:GT2 family glycosyltransferase
MFDTIELDRGQYDDVREIFWASGAALFLRRSALDAVGILDETFFMHYEEIDLCWRLHLYGYKVKVIPQSKVLHYVSASLPAANFMKLYWNHRNSLILLIKNLSSSRFIMTLLQRFILDGVAGLHALIQLEPKRIFAILKAHFWIYAHTVMLFRKRKSVQKSRKSTDKEFDHLIYPKSIVVDYFLKKKKEFHTLSF